MNYKAVIKELPEVIVFSKRLIVPDYNSYLKIIPEIGEEVKKSNPDLKCSVPEYCFVIYHDGEYKDKNIDIELCEAVTKFGNNSGDIIFKKIEKVPESVCVLHKGPYNNLRDAYSFAFSWIEQNGYKVIDNPRESYIDGIWNKEDENEWLTELQIPVKRK
jgi:effector-binding domain-containing protein